MSEEITHSRRRFLGAAALCVATAEMALRGTAQASLGKPTRSGRGCGPIKQVKAGVLDIGYCEAGPSDGLPVLLERRLRSAMSKRAIPRKRSVGLCGSCESTLVAGADSS